MASYAPPTQDSAIFNPLFFVSGQEGLTLNEAKKFFKDTDIFGNNNVLGYGDADTQGGYDFYGNRIG